MTSRLLSYNFTCAFQIENVHGLAILENNLYITNQRNESLVTMDRFDNSTKPRSVLTPNLTHPSAVHVVHRQRQPKGRSAVHVVHRQRQPKGRSAVHVVHRQRQPKGRSAVHVVHRQRQPKGRSAVHVVHRQRQPKGRFVSPLHQEETAQGLLRRLPLPVVAALHQAKL